MTTGDITLNHTASRGEVAWYWTDSTGKIISPYIDDADVAERWGRLYREAVESGMVRVNGVTYSAKK
jgi:hypothetical protein